jgi:ribosomal protein S18 acetylase RimI-like enzyme
MNLEIKQAEFDQETALFHLYRNVAEIPDGIIRNQNEIDQAYISEFVTNSIRNGLILVGMVDGEIVGQIHAYTPTIFAFQHILTDLTIVVKPAYQGEGVGRRLFEYFLKTVVEEYNHILRVELYVREHNRRNLKFYESLGFINEGRQKDKIFTSDVKFETPLHMAWFNPHYKMGKQSP